GEYYAREWVGHVYMDRPLYRPGETIDYKAILRADDDATYSLPSADTTFDITIGSPRGQQLRKESGHPNEFGSFSGTFTLPSGAAVQWSARAYPYTPQVKGYERASFTDWDWTKQSIARDALRAKGTTTTGPNGTAAFGIPATLQTAEGPQLFTLSAAVTDQR